ncbi:MAG: PAS domain-containing protein, partial [Myxococcaceae bacterium]|nr:PAS domain-containing protein [Myxococcaceae bacterium]
MSPTVTSPELLRLGGFVLCRWELTAPFRCLAITGGIEAWGYTPADFLEGRMTWRALVHPDDRPLVDAIALQAVSGTPQMTPLEQEYRIVCGDGSTRWVRTVSVPVFGPDGALVAADGVVVDLRSSEATELRLRKRQAQLELILEASNVGVFDFDFLHGTSLMTPRLRSWFGSDHLDLSTWVDHVHPDDAHVVHTMVRRQVKGESDVVSLEVRVRPNPSSPWRWVHATSQVVERSPSRAPVRSVGVIRDVTAEHEARALREALEQELREAQKARVLAQLSGGVAHDLNNVLQVVQFACRGLEQERLSDEGRLDLARALEAVQRAARLTHQLLAVGSRQDLAVASVDVGALCDDFARRRGIHFVPPAVPLTVRADRAQLEDCLDHLVRNALEANPRSGP